MLCAVEAGEQQRQTAPVIDLPALYQLHWRYLVRLAVLLVDDTSSAEDVVQDAFIALHRNAGNLRDPDAALGYLRTSVVNLARSVLRRRQVARKHLKVAEPEATAPADHDVLLRDEHQAALRAVKALPRHQREVLVLRYWSGLSEREIAQALGISQGSVKSAASRGMATLHTVLGQDR
ncbi:SigE family RNA polymerase sigma factor [Jatrophihabitans endophyticus]|uniref:SigE family RNA polymerase sigma factor n=1 Tax=Jatrophihabitans endophyticus TaxID=1206085 RepID=UPI0019DEF71E|nr:SigE family RNA polymerase sigma factor [Jatrophihabitans endophyticus]MBE7187256.1 SigE family RNA polymerase sigma factor [Jatrophihabitans endophyticus]